MYTDDEKAIFRYNLRGQERCADPDRIRRRLFHKLGTRDLNETLKEINGPKNYAELDEVSRNVVDACAYEATDTLLVAIYHAFETHALDANGQGWTETEAFEVFQKWCDFIADLKKTDASEPSSSTSESPSAAV